MRVLAPKLSMLSLFILSSLHSWEATSLKAVGEGVAKVLTGGRPVTL